MNSDNFGTWLEIDLSTLKKNYEIVSRVAGRMVMPVVKANAYGHGLEKVAACFESAGAGWLGVARIEEALLLREAGVKARILVLGYTSPLRVAHAIKSNVTLTAYDPEVVDAYADQAEKLGEKLVIHAKIDTGMGRLGIRAEQADEFIAQILASPNLIMEGLFTHFACADEPDKPYTDEQLSEFMEIVKKLEKSGKRPALLHASNSAGTLVYPEAGFDMTRAGIVLYGLPPSHEVEVPQGVEPALAWKTRLISSKMLPPNHGVSYGFKYFTKKEERIGVIAVGYADGLRRRPGNQVLIRGKKIDIVGNVCMDQCMVQLDDLPEAEIGDEVVIIGRQDGAEITATDLADDWGTINYEVICGLASRMPRYYLK
ncbi:MAG: alanine racemase [Chloroflexota bacterium]|nr:alanine racemase [Chloroflexota bacterium]